MVTINHLDSICKQFLAPGRLYSYCPFGKGHINNTFLVDLFSEDKKSHFVLQQINLNVFSRPHEVMHNIVMVTNIIREKVHSFTGKKNTYIPLEIIPTRNGEWWFQDENGRAWRMYNYITDSYSVDTLSTPSQAFEAASMFGLFQKCLTKLDPKALFITIPHFHDASHRFRYFNNVIQNKDNKRKVKARREINLLLEYSSLFTLFEQKLKKNKIPVRITHNDTKVNNVLFCKKTHKGISVIDLDTVMPGYSLYDFGDLVRTGTCPACEDESDLRKIYVDRELFRKISEGYLYQAKDFLTEQEVLLFPLAGMYITLIMGMRFLTDYLQGDLYYKTTRPDHNLDRSRTQIALVGSLLEIQKELDDIVHETGRQAGIF